MSQAFVIWPQQGHSSKSPREKRDKNDKRKLFTPSYPHQNDAKIVLAHRFAPIRHGVAMVANNHRRLGLRAGWVAAAVASNRCNNRCYSRCSNRC